MNFKNLSLSAVLLLALGASFASACGGSVDIDFVGEDGSGNGNGGDGSGSCGDGSIDGSEECDDGNTSSGDGCSDACIIESGYSCRREPSECARTVGNGTIDPGEECDDGNVESGDGCSDTGRIEGSCDAPVPVVLTIDDNGNYSGRIESSTNGGGSQLDATECAGDDVGQGPDRVFQVELPTATDLRVRVESTFNPIVRVLGEPCDLDESLACENDGGVGAQEDLRLNNLPAGTYYIAIDGAQANQRGDFTLRVNATCPLENVQLRRMNYYNYDVTLINRSTECAVNLDGIHLGTVSSSSTASSDLPSVLLEPGEEYLLSPYSGDYVDYVIDDDFAYPYYSSAGYYLCRGECDFSDGSNAFDAFFAGTSSPPTPVGDITFDPGPLSSISTYAGYTHYERQAFDGAAPDFLASDWRPVVRLNPSLSPTYGPDTGSWTDGTSTTSWTVVEDEEVGLIGRASSTAATGETVRYFAIEATFATPSYMRVEFRRPGLATEECLFDVWNNTTDTWYPFRFSVTSGSGRVEGSTFTNIGVIDAEAWHVLEFALDWTERTLVATLDGVEGPELEMYPNSVSSIGAFAVGRRNVATATSCDVREIYMY